MFEKRSAVLGLKFSSALIASLVAILFASIALSGATPTGNGTLPKPHVAHIAAPHTPPTCTSDYVPNWGNQLSNQLKGVSMAASPTGNGYVLLSGDGTLSYCGDAPQYVTPAYLNGGYDGSIAIGYTDVTPANALSNLLVIALYYNEVSTWASDGSYNYANYGPPCPGTVGPQCDLNKPIVGMALTPDGNGNWLVAADGGVFSYGDATFYGSTGGITLNQPIVGIASTADGKGYWLVAADGGVFSYGDATFYGSMGGITLNQPIVGIASTADGKGYWLAAADGGVFSFGDATFYGSLGSRPVPIYQWMNCVNTCSGPNVIYGYYPYGTPAVHPTNNLKADTIVSIAATKDGKGYWFMDKAGNVYSFGDAVYYGGAGNF